METIPKSTGITAIKAVLSFILSLPGLCLPHSRNRMIIFRHFQSLSLFAKLNRAHLIPCPLLFLLTWLPIIKSCGYVKYKQWINGLSTKNHCCSFFFSFLFITWQPLGSRSGKDLSEGSILKPILLNIPIIAPRPSTPHTTSHSKVEFAFSLVKNEGESPCRIDAILVKNFFIYSFI